MYYYIVNPNAGNRNFASIQAKLKARLRQLDIDGEFAKTLDAGDAAEITHKALRQGAKTIVVIAGDKTVNEVITAIDQSGRSSTSIGIIPIGHNNTLAEAIGVHDWQQACEVLAARRLRAFRLMHINDHNFIHSCKLEAKTTPVNQALLEIDGSFRMKADIESCTISNAKLHNPDLPNQLLIRFDQPQSEAATWKRLLSHQYKPVSQVHARVAILEFADTYKAELDGRVIEDSYFRIRLSDKPLQVITAKHNYGRERV